MKTWLATQARALTGNWTGDPLLRRPALSPLSHSNQGCSIPLCEIISDWLDFCQLKIPWLTPIFATGGRFSKVGFGGDGLLGFQCREELLANQKWDGSNPQKWDGSNPQHAVASWLYSIYYHPCWQWLVGIQVAAVERYGTDSGLRLVVFSGSFWDTGWRWDDVVGTWQGASHRLCSALLQRASLEVSFFKDFMGKGGRKRGRQTLMWERNIDGCLSYVPQPGTEPATQAYALTMNQTGNLLLWGTMPNQLRHTSQGHLLEL